MKRVFAILLALVMVLSLGVTAFAAEEKGSITITNATVGEVYILYKVFDATIKLAADGKTAEGVAYSITEDNQLFDDLFGEDGKTPNEYFVYNADTHAVTKKDGADDAKLIEYLRKLITETSGLEPAARPVLAVENVTDEVATYLDEEELKELGLKAEDLDKVEAPSIVFNDLPYGYYLFTSTLGTAVTINSNSPDVQVIDKNQEPGTDFDKQIWDEEQQKWVDANSANIGDGITYQISFTATNYDGDKKIKHYMVHDDKGDAIWAEFNSIQVWVNGVELPRGYYLSQGGDPDNGTWLWLGDHDNTCTTDGWDDIPAEEKVRDNAQWYLVHLGYDQYRVTIPWLEGHAVNDVTDAAGNVTSYSLTYPDNAASKFDSPADVIITYNAVVEPGASIGDTTHGNRFNKAYATWTSEYETGTTPPDEVVTHVYGIGLLKDDSTTGQNLAGATFRIYKDKECTQPVYVIPTDVEGVYMVDSLGTPSESVTGSKMEDTRERYGHNMVDYLKDKDGNPLKDENGDPLVQDNRVISQVNGKLAVLGLEAGSYFLKEVEPPKGYNALIDPIELKAGEGTRPFYIFADEDGKVADIQEEDGIHKEIKYELTHTVVHNSKGVQLPTTGGEGAIMLITIGTLIAIGFAVLLITQKKMSIYRD